jgi:hypothetical protein
MLQRRSGSDAVTTSLGADGFTGRSNVRNRAALRLKATHGI